MEKFTKHELTIIISLNAVVVHVVQQQQHIPLWYCLDLMGITYRISDTHNNCMYASLKYVRPQIQAWQFDAKHSIYHKMKNEYKRSDKITFDIVKHLPV